MKYMFVIIATLVAITWAQTTIPPPSDIAAGTGQSWYFDTVVYTGPDTVTRTIYTTASSVDPVKTQSIGDFDGDGGEELYIIWELMYGSATLKYYRLTGDTIEYYPINGFSNEFYQYSIYSLKKNTHLINSPFGAVTSYNPGFGRRPPIWPGTVVTGDFNGDTCVDFVVGDKIYTTTYALVKKKY